jgi:hypothetical protein
MERAYTASNPLFALIDFWIWGFCYWVEKKSF